MDNYLVWNVVRNGFGDDFVASGWVYDINGMMADSKEAIIGLELAQYLNKAVSFVFQRMG